MNGNPPAEVPVESHVDPRPHIPPPTAVRMPVNAPPMKPASQPLASSPPVSTEAQVGGPPLVASSPQASIGVQVDARSHAPRLAGSPSRASAEAQAAAQPYVSPLVAASPSQVSTEARVDAQSDVSPLVAASPSQVSAGVQVGGPPLVASSPQASIGVQVDARSHAPRLAGSPSQVSTEARVDAQSDVSPLVAASLRVSAAARADAQSHVPPLVASPSQASLEAQADGPLLVALSPQVSTEAQIDAQPHVPQFVASPSQASAAVRADAQSDVSPLVAASPRVSAEARADAQPHVPQFVASPSQVSAAVQVDGPLLVAASPSQASTEARVDAQPVVPPQATGRILLARAYLLRVAEPPAPALAALVAALGPEEAADRVKAGEVPTAVAEETNSRRHLDLAERDLADAAAVGARLLIPEDPDWPAWPLSVLDLVAARGVRWAGQPLALWIKGTGRLAELADRAVAVIGARAATSYGERVAAEFGHDLAGRGFTVVSGAAYGVDGAAHRGALAAGRPTVAVLGCGVAVPYPAGHAALLARIAESGAVLSEYPPGTPPARHRFLVRNRLIAALAGGTVVIEAGVRSGARNTAATAAALGRTVLAVPGPISSAMSVGCHELIRSGAACLAGRVEDVVELVGRLGDEIAERAPGEVHETDGLDDRSLRVFEALSSRTPRSAGQLAVASGLALERVRAALPVLELRGMAVHGEFGWLASQQGGSAGKQGDRCGDT